MSGPLPPLVVLQRLSVGLRLNETATPTNLTSTSTFATTLTKVAFNVDLSLPPSACALDEETLSFANEVSSSMLRKACGCVHYGAHESGGELSNKCCMLLYCL
jgi:hypothetical protein